MKSELGDTEKRKRDHVNHNWEGKKETAVVREMPETTNQCTASEKHCVLWSEKEIEEEEAGFVHLFPSLSLIYFSLQF